MPRWSKLGVIAGGGPLPARVARASLARNEPVYLIRLDGFADEMTRDLPGESCGIGEAGKLIRILKDQGCDGVVLAGLVQRPDFHALKLDWRGAALLPKVVAAAARGDGALLSVLVDTLESEGFIVVGAEEVTRDLIAPEGAYGASAPTEKQFEDIKKAASVVRALGQYDIGQGAVVASGLVLAVEAAEGTDAMLDRCASFHDNLRGGDGANGVLVKRPKPGQELRVDLPTVGADTIRAAARAKLAGIAIEAGRTLVMDMEEMTRVANELGIFVYGFTASEVREA